MLDNIVEKFFQSGAVDDALTILKTCRAEKLYYLGAILAKYFCQLFPFFPEILIESTLETFCSKDYEFSYQLHEILLQECRCLPREQVKAALFNQHHCIKYIADRYTYYNRDLVQKIQQRLPNPLPLVTFTITTCKRYDLFQQTMNSFLNCCVDLDKIDAWFCVDDNSSSEDCKKMKENYPFFQFYWKNMAEKGHPQSMNIIRNYVQTPYIFHIEDDWKFFTRRDYITFCLDVLSQNAKIGQCLINCNYAEIAENINFVGGVSAITHSGRRYIIHEHTSTEEQKQAFQAKYGAGPNCAYWPHYSFRPSLLKRQVWQELGPFNEAISHFEMEYSYRYRDNGYISTFMEGIYCLHIGRLTSERFDQSKDNAYILNNEAQLGGKEEQLEKKKLTGGINIKTFVINLDKRADRWKSFDQKKETSFLSPQRFSAVDGSLLQPTEQLQRIFDGNDFNMRQGMVGCAMSHLKIYLELINSNYESFCILEDDLNFVPNFKEKFLHLYKNLPADWDMCYLGHHLWKQKQTDDSYDKVKMPVAERWNSAQSFQMSMGGTIGYLLSKKGAFALLEFINENGMTNGIDTVQQKAADIVHIYYCQPHLVYSECWTGDNDPDTDIQHNFHSLTIPIDKRIKNEIDYYGNFRTISVLNKREDVVNCIGNKEKKDVMIYHGPGIKGLISLIVHPFYTLNYQVLVVVPNPDEKTLQEKYFQRLKKNGKFSIQDALILNPVSATVIPFSEMGQIYPIVNDIEPINVEYPFDKIHGGTFEVFSLLTEMVLTKTEDELKKFCHSFFDFDTNETYIQSYNQKTVFRNTKYRLSFPHDNNDTLVSVYTKRFQNLCLAVKGEKPLLFIQSTIWPENKIEPYYHFIDVIKKYNSRVKMLVINGFPQQPSAQYEKFIEKIDIPYSEKFRNDETWPAERIAYENQVFTPLLKNPIENFLRRTIF